MYFASVVVVRNREAIHSSEDDEVEILRRQLVRATLFRFCWDSALEAWRTSFDNLSSWLQMQLAKSDAPSDLELRQYRWNFLLQLPQPTLCQGSSKS